MIVLVSEVKLCYNEDRYQFCLGPEIVHQTQRILNGHVSEWIKMTGMGEKWKHVKRQRETHIDHGESVAPLYLLIKDHKPYDPAVQLPPSRPVCKAGRLWSSQGGHGDVG